MKTKINTVKRFFNTGKCSKIVAGCIVLAFVACTSTETTKIEFTDAILKKTINLVKDKKSPKLDLDMKVAYVKGDDSIANTINNVIEEQLFMLTHLPMQQAVDSFANIRSNEYVKDMLPMYKSEPNNGEPSPWYEAIYTIKSYFEQKSDTILNYIAEQETYDGGAHGLFTKIVMNFNTNTGKIMTINDVLVPGYEQRLNEILLNKLIKKTESKNIDDLREKGYLANVDMAPSQFYIINDNGITFIYNQYEIAPYSMGMTEINIGWDELKDIKMNIK